MSHAATRPMPGSAAEMVEGLYGNCSRSRICLRLVKHVALTSQHDGHSGRSCPDSVRSARLTTEVVGQDWALHPRT
jgi:hypothetical protein